MSTTSKSKTPEKGTASAVPFLMIWGPFGRVGCDAGAGAGIRAMPVCGGEKARDYGKASPPGKLSAKQTEGGVRGALE